MSKAPKDLKILGWEKERVGFGRWGIVLRVKCPYCGYVFRLHAGYRGPGPKGAIRCPNCHRLVGLPYFPIYGAMSAKAVAKQYWFGPIVAKRLATKGHTGWRKKDPAEKRRRTMIRAHDGDILAAARACQALANVTKDPETKRKAAADAKYLFRLYRRKKG